MNKLVLVTGASRGIGKAIAEQMARLGYRVIGTATTEQGAQCINDYLSVITDQHMGCVLDVADRQSIDSLIDLIKTRYEQLPDILINNAGITRDSLFMRMKDDDWQMVIQTNLTGVFYLTKACVNSMVKTRWGRVISIGSVVAQMGNAGQVNYCAAKAGVEGFSRALAKEVASRNITVNVIAPGFIATDMTDNLSDKQKQVMLNNVPMNRMGLPDDIAKATIFLASDDAKYITGVTLPINGGLYC